MAVGILFWVLVVVLLVARLARSAAATAPPAGTGPPAHAAWWPGPSVDGPDPDPPGENGTGD